MPWHTYCLLRLSVIERGRAVPLVWCVLAHGSAQVTVAAYQEFLTKHALLLPGGGKEIFLADGGGAETELMAHLQRLRWHWRIRIQSRFWLYRRGHRRCKGERLPVARGQGDCWAQVSITGNKYGPVIV